jgi:Carboxypeptidase regulatory-like domain
MLTTIGRLIRAAAVLAGISGVLCAQQFRGTITGVLRDAQSAVIPNARVTATQSETGAVSQTVTSPTGQFNLPFLAPGTYSITIEATGFKRYVRDGLLVSANDPVALDVTLEVGQTSESVTISADSPLLQTETASTGQVINSKQVEDMPLNGRTPLVLAQLSFGVIPNNDPRFYRPFDDSGPSGFAMGGAPAKQNAILLDGAGNASVGNGLGFSPPVDAVTEVKVESFQADASLGHTGGGTVNVITKSGTNVFHGSVYDFYQNSALGANLFFTNLAGQKKLSSIYNQGGTTAGGPVFIPKVINGTNRVFFFSRTKVST